MRQGTAGGWASLNFLRIYGLLTLNTIGIHGFNGLPVIEFNKPTKFWDGTETLSYSYRLNVSYHPHYRYQDDIRSLGGPTLVMIGAHDEAIDPRGIARALYRERAERADDGRTGSQSFRHIQHSRGMGDDRGLAEGPAACGNRKIAPAARSIRV